MGQTARGARIGVLDLFVPVGEDSHEPAAVRFPIIPRNTRVRPMSPIAQYDEIDNPYRSTATLEMAGEVTETELRAFVGPKFDYYLRKWGPKLEDPSADCGMNWAAFFLSGFWFPYRKMYAATFILYGVSLALAIVQQVVFVAVIGADVAEKLFENVDPLGKQIRVLSATYTVVGVTEKKGRMLGQSFDGFVLLPITTFESLYGRRRTTTISVKMATAEEVAEGMALADGAMRTAHRLKPGEESDYSIETADALIDFWKNLTRVLFSVIPAIVGIGIVVGGIVIMNIMLMSVSERTREIGVRKALGARSRDIRRQFLVESIVLASIGGLLGVLAGWGLAQLVALASPLPAKVTAWSVALALSLGAGVGVLFGVYPASRAAELDPIAALRQE